MIAVIRNILYLSKDIHRRNDGAVTVDWVVLTASIVALAASILYTLWGVNLERAAAIGDAIVTMVSSNLH